MQNNLFYKYYDLVFQAKDYGSETGLVFKLTEKFGIDSPKKILEIGCGTGNHTQVLLTKNIPLVAIDNDPVMIELARKKFKQNSNLKIILSDVENLREGNFDLGLAMFNVVTYISEERKLDSFMKSTYEKLNPGAVFIFDCWNGVAAIKDPPKPKKTILRDGNAKIILQLIPKTDLFNQKTELKYNIRVINDALVEQDSFSFSQTLWTPMQIKNSLERAGFKLILCSPIMNIKKQASAVDWKIMFCAKKTK